MPGSFPLRMQRSKGLSGLLTLAGLVAAVPAFTGGLAKGEFVPGRIYAAAVYGDIQYKHLPPVIWEFDPATGQSRKFATLPNPPYDTVTGLRFTPDGAFLRALTFYQDEMLEMDGSGQFRTVFDREDGLRRPRYMDYEAGGNLFVQNAETGEILKFPFDGGPPSVFAERPWVGGGRLAAGPGGELYHARATHLDIVHFEADGSPRVWLRDERTRFVDYLLTDTDGCLFANFADRIYRFEEGDPNTGTLLAQIHSAGTGRLVLSPDQRTLYLANFLGVWAIDPETGETRELGRWPEEAFYYPYWGPTDVALYIPEPIPIHGALALLLCRRRRPRSKSNPTCKRSRPCLRFEFEGASPTQRRC